MNITFSIDEVTAKEAQKIAEEIGTTLDQLVSKHLKMLAKKNQSSTALSEFVSLSGQGHSSGRKFHRNERY